MSQALLNQHKNIWQDKPLLRAIYTDWYKEIVRWALPGKTLEIGSGSGNFKEFMPESVSTDIVKLPWLDAVLDAHHLPFRSESFNNIITFDVVHHLQNPTDFIRETSRVLMPGGRLVMMEPYISAVSYPVYRFLHPEPLDMGTDPFEVTSVSAERKPFDANQAIPKLLLESYWKRFEGLFPEYTKLLHKRLAFFAYPLSGGFDHPALIPTRAYPQLRRLENWLSPLGRLFAFRFLVVLEKVKEV
ncbi:class I SAM-dependent methyltransferase [Elusimicrobiota bacterium]